MFKAEVIADSLNPSGNRITTFVITFPRIILAELNTHRILSKNSASSRAIPYKRMLKSVLENPFIPIGWMKDHSGMQGNEFYDREEKFNVVQLKDIILSKLAGVFESEEDKDTDLKLMMYDRIMDEFGKDAYFTLDEFWLKIRDKVITSSLLLACLGVSKQICNRLLEPFMWHTVIITGTEWENFFALRVHPAAEIHMQKIAGLMLDAYNESTPKQLKIGEWHIPYGENINLTDYINNFVIPSAKPGDEITPEFLDLIKVKVATARCARVSYTTVGDGRINPVDKDLELHDKAYFSKPLHASPFEHCGQAGEANVQSGNFKGFIQYRKMLEGENASDPRVIKKFPSNN